MRLLVKQAVRALEGELVIPSSKYHAHRALILASLAPGTSRIEGLSDARHVRYTIQALRGLGTEITVDGDTFIVHGGPYQPARPDVSVGSSGTTLYFLTGLASLADRAGDDRRARSTSSGARSARCCRRCPGWASSCPPRTAARRSPSSRGGPPAARCRSPARCRSGSPACCCSPRSPRGPTSIEVDGELNERTYIDLTIR